MCSFISACTPLIRLYEDITAQGFASLIAISNGRRYNSRRGRSWIMESILNLSVSCSLPTKSVDISIRHVMLLNVDERLIVAATPCPCRPWIYDAASFPVKYGSSENASKFRPPRGPRCRHTVGASRTCADLALVSSPRCWPTSKRIFVFHVAANETPQGNKAAW